MIHYILLKTKKIIRDDKGVKQVGAFPNWRNPALHKKAETFSSVSQERASAIVVGPSRMKVIDVDDNELYDRLILLNEELSPEQRCKLIVKSDLKGGHFYFNDEPSLLDNYLGNPQDGAKIYKIDYQTGNRLIFTWINNETKTLISQDADSPEELTRIPDSFSHFIKSYKLENDLALKEATTQTTKTQTTSDINIDLAPLVDNILNAVNNNIKNNSLNTLLNIVIPREYKKKLKEKEGLQYHPDTLPEGEGGHMLLVSIGGVLMRDSSISPESYEDMMLFINNLYSRPDPSIKTIIKRDLTSDKFVYDPDWKMKTLSLLGKDGNRAYKVYLVEDANTETYMFVDDTTQKVTIGKKQAILGLIQSKMMTNKNIKSTTLASFCRAVALINNPILPFGLDIENNTYNVFKRNQVQKIFYNPEDYKELANTYPNTILTYLTHITGSVKKRDMFCQFLANKLKTHEYSPLIFVLWGVPGSGKNTLTSKVLAPLVEGRDIVNLTIDNLKDKFNSVFKEKDFLVLDEVHTLSPLNKRDFVNLINALSGKQKIAERKMFNSFMEQFDNEFTIIMTTNKPTEVTTEANDRRIVVFRSEKQLSEVFNKSDDEIISRLEEEIYSFAYYLSQLPKIDSSSYTKNYNWIEGDEDYSEFMTESKSYAFRIYKALQTRDYYALLDILFDADILDDEFVASVTKEPRGYALRLTNSKPNIAKVPGLVDHPNLAIKQENIVSELNSLAKEYKQYFMYVDALEYENGVKTGSKKTAYRLDIDKLPDNIKQKIEDKFRDMEPDDLTGADDDK